jgi:hypothetical protein
MSHPLKTLAGRMHLARTNPRQQAPPAPVFNVALAGQHDESACAAAIYCMQARGQANAKLIVPPISARGGRPTRPSTAGAIGGSTSCFGLRSRMSDALGQGCTVRPSTFVSTVSTPSGGGAGGRGGRGGGGLGLVGMRVSPSDLGSTRGDQPRPHRIDPPARGAMAAHVREPMRDHTRPRPRQPNGQAWRADAGCYP